ASRSPARHEDHVGAGRGVLEDTRVIRQLIPHSCPGEARRSLLVAYGSAGVPGAFLRRLARARPRDVRAPLRARPSPGLALLRDDKTRSLVAQKFLFFPNGPRCPPSSRSARFPGKRQWPSTRSAFLPGRGVRPRPAPRAGRVRRSPLPPVDSK